MSLSGLRRGVDRPLVTVTTPSGDTVTVWQEKNVIILRDADHSELGRATCRFTQRDDPVAQLKKRLNGMIRELRGS
jgi:hypothetical protein